MYPVIPLFLVVGGGKTCQSAARAPLRPADPSIRRRACRATTTTTTSTSTRSGSTSRSAAARRKGPRSPTPVVTAFGEKLDYLEDHFEKRILFDKGRLPAEIDVEIAGQGPRRVIKERFPLPAWLVLTEPKPAVVDPGEDLAVGWRFSRFPPPSTSVPTTSGPGKEFFREDHVEGTDDRHPGRGPARARPSSASTSSNPGSTSATSGGPDYARGSEVNVIPWSQVFVRTK